ncbi:hypothetical protein EYF80_022382 [Liparis tanakae]|uniref:Uncharacterized protein n=1 Tax=Liparis tanakae TaxID=230148 RepID=A0A4Z2HNI8_9TELE|nr:hypothetical protein EYF80_022382 [Liparis tanakae]
MAAGPVGQWTGNPSMKRRAAGTDCGATTMNASPASDVGNAGPEEEKQREKRGHTLWRQETTRLSL